MDTVFNDCINNTLSKMSMDKLRSSTILVTGAAGFVGSMIIEALVSVSEVASLNIRIIGMTRRTSKQRYNFDKDRTELYYGDICENLNIIGDVDYIIHCASITNSQTMKSYPIKTFLTSIMGTRNILDLASDKKIKSMVYISSMEAYGTNACNPYTTKDLKNNCVTEDMLGYIELNNSRSSYPEGKRAAEFLCNAYYSEYGVPVKIARLAQTFGPGVSVTDNRVFAQFARSAINGTDIVLHTDGSSEGNYCHIADTVTGILTILLKGYSGETYNVVNEKLHMNIRQMAEFVAEEIGRGKIKVTTQIPEHSNQYGYAPPTKLRLSAEKLRALGWSPIFNMKDMYEHMIEYWNKD